MYYIFVGICGYLCFYTGELLSVRMENVFPTILFVAGCIMNTVSTVYLCIYDSPLFFFHGSIVITVLTGIISGIFFFLLIYSLFFAFPADEAYLKFGKKKVCDTGLYALCRHPGVLFLSLFYLFLWLSAGKLGVFAAFAVFTTLDVVYVLIQDFITFPRIFDGYENYRKTTPFLIPGVGSVKRCFATLKRNERK